MRSLMSAVASQMDTSDRLMNDHDTANARVVSVSLAWRRVNHVQNAM